MVRLKHIKFCVFGFDLVALHVQALRVLCSVVEDPHYQARTKKKKESGVFFKWDLIKGFLNSGENS